MVLPRKVSSTAGAGWSARTTSTLSSVLAGDDVDGHDTPDETVGGLVSRIYRALELVAQRLQGVGGGRRHAARGFDVQDDVDVVGGPDRPDPVVDGVQLRHQAADQRPLVAGQDAGELCHVRPRVGPAAGRTADVDRRAVGSSGRVSHGTSPGPGARRRYPPRVLGRRGTLRSRARPARCPTQRFWRLRRGRSWWLARCTGLERRG